MHREIRRPNFGRSRRCGLWL